MNSVANDMRDIFVTNGVGVFAGTTAGTWAIYIGDLPEAPDECITLVDTGGTPADPICLRLDQIQREEFTVYVRSTGYNGAYLKIHAIERLIDRTKTTVGQVDYALIHRLTTPRFAGYDQDRRAVWEQRWRVLRQIGSSSSSSSSGSSSSGSL